MLLRDPIARAASMMDHHRSRSKRGRETSYADLLADDRFVRRQLLDYQTRMLAFDTVDECPDSVHRPLEIGDARFGRALERLAAVDVLGVVEALPAFTSRLQQVTGIRPGQNAARTVLAGNVRRSTRTSEDGSRR